MRLSSSVCWSPGREAVRLGEVERAAQLLADALAVWRGSVLDDLGPPEFAHTDVARLEELRLTALDLRIDADLALGRHHSVIGELERLVVAHPFHERLHCQLMLALYRSGRQADALAVSSSVRQHLADELGIDPGPALRDMETAILRHDPALLFTPTEVNHTAVPSVPAGASTKYHPPVSTRSHVTRGRLIDLLRAGGRRRLTLIHGPAGFGKTTLAAQWRDVLADDGITVAWLTIDSDDNNVVWFLAHLIDAVRSVRPTSGEGLRQALEARGEEAEHYVLTSVPKLQANRPLLELLLRGSSLCVNVSADPDADKRGHEGVWPHIGPIGGLNTKNLPLAPARK